MKNNEQSAGGSPISPPDAPAIRRRWFILLPAIFAAVGLGVRIYPMSCDFSIDEAWSYYHAGQMNSPADVFFGVHHDNNHHLNTLYMHLAGQGRDGFIYRLFSLAAGIATIIIATLIGLNESKSQGIITGALACVFYPLVAFSSEARGYAPAVFFAFLAYYSLELFLRSRTVPRAMVFMLACIGGVLSHLTFLFCYAGLMVWSAIGLLRGRKNISSVAGNMLLLHAAPAMFFAWLYFVDVRWMTIGGANEYDLIATITAAAAWMMGMGNLPSHEEILIAILAAAILILGCALSWRREPGKSAFFAISIVIVPIASVLLFRPPALYIRYFLIGISLYLIILGRVLTWLIAKQTWGRVLFLIIAICFLCGNCLHVAELYLHGRGQYAQAVRFIAENSQSRDVLIAGDNNFRVGNLLKFHSARADTGKNLQYCPPGSVPLDTLGWFIAHTDTDEQTEPRDEISIGNPAAGNERKFTLVKKFPTAPLSGLGWYVYQSKP